MSGDRFASPRLSEAIKHAYFGYGASPGRVCAGRRNCAGQNSAPHVGIRGLPALTNSLYACPTHNMERCNKWIPGPRAPRLPMEGRAWEIEPEITACVVQAGCK